MIEVLETDSLIVIITYLSHKDICNLSTVNNTFYEYISDSWNVFAYNNYQFDVDRSHGRNKSQKYWTLERNMLHIDDDEFAVSNYRRNAILLYKFNLPKMILPLDKQGKHIYHCVKSLCIAFNNPKICFGIYLDSILYAMTYLPSFVTDYLFKYGIVELNNKYRKKVIPSHIQQRLPSLFANLPEHTFVCHFDAKMMRFLSRLLQWDKNDRKIVLDNFFPSSTFPIARKYFSSC